MEIISLEDVLNDMERLEKGKPVPFDVEVVRLDLKRSKGGTRTTYKNAVLSRTGGNNSKTFSYRNNARNIITPGMEHPEAIHPILIIRYNGKEVSL